VRLNGRATFDASLVYDAPPDLKRSKAVEGDAGKEIAGAVKGAGGAYTLKIGPQTFNGTVKAGINVISPSNRVTLEPGAYEIRVAADTITGEELFRLRRLELRPAGQ
jgi:hypothetical protein